MLSNDAMEDDRRQPTIDKPSIAKVTRKKFAKPPVKVACLSWYVRFLYSFIYIYILSTFCSSIYSSGSSTPKKKTHLIYRRSTLTHVYSRASRIRCDGKDPCSCVRATASISFLVGHSSFFLLSLICLPFFCSIPEKTK